MGLYTNEIVSILKLLRERARANYAKNSLCMIGKQDLQVDLSLIYKFVKQYEINCNAEEFEKLMKNDTDNIDSIEFFKILGFSDVHAADISAYEGADIILDLNKELPPDLYQRFDFVIDGGTLEHVFDIATAIKNMANMVKKEGYIIHGNPAAGCVNHGFYSISPYMYSEFYQANGFEINALELRFRKYDITKKFHYVPFADVDCRLISNVNRFIFDMQRAVGDEFYVRTSVFCVARRKDDSPVGVYPIQNFDV